MPNMMWIMYCLYSILCNNTDMYSVEYNTLCKVKIFRKNFQIQVEDNRCSFFHRFGCYFVPESNGNEIIEIKLIFFSIIDNCSPSLPLDTKNVPIIWRSLHKFHEYSKIIAFDRHRLEFYALVSPPNRKEKATQKAITLQTIIIIIIFDDRIK